MIDNLFIRVDNNEAYKVYAIVEAKKANSFHFGAVMDTVGDTAIITSLLAVKLSEHIWEADKSLPKLQIGHEFIRITQ